MAGPTVGTVTDPDDIINTAVITGTGPWTLTITPKEGPSVDVFTASVQVADANATNSPVTISVQQTVNASGGSPGTVVNALVGTFNSTGSGVVSSGFPLKQGQLTDAQFANEQVKVSVGGVEKQIYCEALRGRYPDGSIRSVLIQFTHNTAATSTWEDATVEVGGATRGTVDISKTTITSTILESGRSIIPKDVSHTKDCWVTFQPILDAAEETSTHTGHLVEQFENRFDEFRGNGVTLGTYQSTYEVPISMFARWQAHGSTAEFAGASTTKYRDVLWEGLRRSYYTLTNGFLPSTSSPWNPEPNTNNLTRTASGDPPPEWHSQRVVSWCSAYLLTGAIEYWNSVCAHASIGTWYNTSQSQAATLDLFAPINANYGIRFNLRHFWAIMASVTIDATKGFQNTNVGVTGRDLGGSSGAPTQLPWYLNAWITHEYDLGDHRDGFIGCYDGNTDTLSEGGVAGDFQNFQAALATRALLFWWLNVQATDTVAARIKTNVDIFVDSQLVPITGDGAAANNYNAGARWGCPYLCTATPPNPAGNTTHTPFLIPMWADAIAFCKAKYGDAKYATALGRVLHEANVEADSGGSIGSGGEYTWGEVTANWSGFGKIWGEAFGYCTAAPSLDVDGLPSGVPATIRTPTQY